MSWELLGPAALHPDPNKIRGGRPTITSDDVRLALAGLGDEPFLFGMAAFLGHQDSMERIGRILHYRLKELAEKGRWGAGRDRHGKGTGELTSDDHGVLDRMSGLLLFETISARARHDTYAHEAALPEGSATVLCPLCRGRGIVSHGAAEEELLESDVDAELAREALGEPPLDKALRASLVAHWRAARRRHYALRARCRDDECGLCRGKGRFLLTDSQRARIAGVAKPTWHRRWAGRYAEALAIPQAWEAIATGYVRSRLRRS